MASLQKLLAHYQFFYAGAKTGGLSEGNTMAKSSINFKPVLPSSEAHNTREQELDYVFSEPQESNEHWIAMEHGTIEERMKKIRSDAKAIAIEQGKKPRKLSKNADLIREAVVNLNQEHSMDDLKDLAKSLESQYGIQCFQIHIHRDEGKGDPKSEKAPKAVNYHAHMLFDWLERDRAKSVSQSRKIASGGRSTIEVPAAGKTKKLNKLDMSKIQTLVAESLGMDRGELKVNSNRERLEPIEYKRQQEELRVQELQAQVEALEQKKNAAEQGHIGAAEEESKEIARKGLDSWEGSKEQALTILRAVELQDDAIEKLSGQIKSTAGAYKLALADEIKTVATLKTYKTQQGEIDIFERAISKLETEGTNDQKG